MNTKKIRKVKKVKKSYPSCTLHIISTQNYTKLYATTNEGNLIHTSTAGMVGYSGAKRSTPHAATEAAIAMVEKLKEFQVETLKIILKYIYPGRDPAYKAISNGPFKIESVKDKTPVRHGGCRPAGRRRT
jgi:small subunit ribosomal protein S11